MSDQKPYLRGLPIHLADGKQYLFPSVRLGTRGDPVRQKLRDYSDLMIKFMDLARDVVSDGDPSKQSQLVRDYNKRADELSDLKDLAFISLCATVLEENYGPEQAKEISQTLLTPEVIPVILQVIRSGQYPENFIQPH